MTTLFTETTFIQAMTLDTSTVYFYSAEEVSIIKVEILNSGDTDSDDCLSPPSGGYLYWKTTPTIGSASDYIGTLKVRNSAGEEIYSIGSQLQTGERFWYGKDNDNNTVTAGTYYAWMEIDTGDGVCRSDEHELLVFYVKMVSPSNDYSCVNEVVPCVADVYPAGTTGTWSWKRTLGLGGVASVDGFADPSLQNTTFTRATPDDDSYGRVWVVLERPSGGSFGSGTKRALDMKKLVVYDVDFNIDHVCTNAVHPDTHDVAVTVAPTPLGTTIDLELKRVDGAAGAAKFTQNNSSSITISGSTNLTVLGTTASDVVSNMVMEATLGTFVCASDHFTVVDVTKLTITEALHSVNTTNDVTQANETNMLYICQTSNDTATVGLDFTWKPAGVSSNQFYWEIRTLDDNDAPEWTEQKSDFEANPATNLVWTLPTGSTTNREFQIRAWYDCYEDGNYSEDEPHRIVHVTVADFTKLMLTNSATGKAVIDVTRPDEPASTNNTLYLIEGTNGTAQMSIQGWWTPETVSSNSFRWDIVLTNGTAGATQWDLTNGVFSPNPRSVTWTNSASSGVTNREFLVRGWYDCDKDSAYAADEPHRSLYVTVLKVDLDIDSDNNNALDDPDRSPIEESLEDEPGHPGKALAINHLDRDKDGIPDFADGFDIEFGGVSQAGTNASHNFVPVIFAFSDNIDTNTATVKFSGDFISNPATDVSRTGTGTNGNPHVYSIVGDGRVRLWRGKNGSDSRLKASVTAGGDAILKDEIIRLPRFPLPTGLCASTSKP
jgi:hypothetical protein